MMVWGFMYAPGSVFCELTFQYQCGSARYEKQTNQLDEGLLRNIRVNASTYEKRDARNRN